MCEPLQLNSNMKSMLRPMMQFYFSHWLANSVQHLWSFFGALSTCPVLLSKTFGSKDRFLRKNIAASYRIKKKLILKAKCEVVNNQKFDYKFNSSDWTCYNLLWFFFVGNFHTSSRANNWNSKTVRGENFVE